MLSVGDAQEFIAQNSSRKLEMSPQEKLLLVSMQQPGHRAWSTHSMADIWEQHQHTSHHLPAWPVCESMWLYSGHTSPGREIQWSSPALTGFTACGVDSCGEHWHSSPAAWLTFSHYPGTEVLSKDIETTGKWIFPCSLHSC